jgi:hypothetical protein
MLFMMEWKFKSYQGNAEAGYKKFLATGAPMPEGCKLVGRWHAPGSGNGWLIADTDDIAHCYEHASEWAELLEWTTTPILTDEQAGGIVSKVWGAKEN